MFTLVFDTPIAVYHCNPFYLYLLVSDHSSAFNQTNHEVQTTPQFQRHMEGCEKGTKGSKSLLSCPYCPFVFQKSTLHHLHCDSHSDGGLRCVECRKHWQDWRSLRTHYHRKHSSILSTYVRLLFQCGCCGCTAVFDVTWSCSGNCDEGEV